MLPPDRTDKLSRARRYPYDYPGRSYAWHGAGLRPFAAGDCAGRTPVLAVGSNRAPERLLQKYGDAHDRVIPVQQARMADFDIVYAAHVTVYGAIPAMLQHAPGVTVDLTVTWLDEHQLEVMHATEGNYHFALLEDVRVELDGGGTLDAVHLYVGRRGHLVHDGAAVGLTAMTATGRPYTARTTAEMLEAVHGRIAPDLDPEDFILRLIDDAGFRRDCTDLLSADAVAFAYPFKVFGSFDC